MILLSIYSSEMMYNPRYTIALLRKYDKRIIILTIEKQCEPPTSFAGTHLVSLHWCCPFLVSYEICPYNISSCPCYRCCLQQPSNSKLERERGVLAMHGWIDGRMEGFCMKILILWGGPIYVCECVCVCE